MSAQVAVGKDVLSYCSKCKLTLSHIIASMKDNRTIAKVKCNTCLTVQMYKDPSNTITKSKGASKKTATKSQIASKSQPISEIWMEALNKTTKKSQPYSPKTKFIIGDIIDHTKFGPGIVQTIIDSTKMEVVFRHEIKTLVHNIVAA